MIDEELNAERFENASNSNSDDLMLASDLEKAVESIQYPFARRDVYAASTFHGVEIADPFRYLEDSDREETRVFIEEQNALFQSFISKSTSLSLIKDKLTGYWNYKKISVPVQRGTRQFYWKNSGTQNQDVMYVRDRVDGPERVVLDPNVMQKDGSISIVSIGISNDGEYLGYGMSENGSDWTTIKVRDVNCGHDLVDTLRYSKLTAIRWTRDAKGFFYQRFPVPLDGYGQARGTDISFNKGMKVYYHRLGTFQEDDISVVGFPNNPNWTMGIELSDDCNYLFVYASDVIGEKNLYYANIQNGVKEGLKLHALLGEPGSHSYLANDDNTAYFVTNVGAPNFHVVTFDLNDSNPRNWTVVVPESLRSPIHWASVVNQNKLVICYIDNVKSRIEIRDLKTGLVLHQLGVPVGTASGHFGRRVDETMYIKMESYIDPGTMYRVDFRKNGKVDMSVYNQLENPSLDLSQVEMTHLSYSSDDGTNIPVYLVHRKDMVLDGNRPCLLTAYGGYGVSTLPHFNVSYLTFVQNFKGVVAIPAIRGGGEFGKRWWDEGRLLNKQNGFDDFIGAARFLVHNKYTRTEKLAIQGLSSGGLLVGAVVNQQPELFGAAIPQVGIMDMLRFQKFTIGHLWCGEFGYAEEDETHFNYLKSYSPLHNIQLPLNQSVQYPAILATTADHDDRVVPAHSMKYIAELQSTVGSSPRQTNPLLLRIDSKSGHGYGKPISKRIQETADIFAFLEKTLHIEFQV